MKSNDKILLAILWPFAGLITSLKHWRQPWAMNMFWVVCMYLGAIQIYHPEGTVLGDGADSGRYVLQLMDMYNNVHSFSDVSKYFYEGGTIDIFCSTLTFFVSRFTDNGHVFFFFVALIFGFFYSRNVWYILGKLPDRLPKWTWVLIMYFFLVCPIWLINGVRMWTATHIFAYGALPFLLDGDKKKLPWCFASILVHHSFIFPIALLSIYLLISNRIISKQWIITALFVFYLLTLTIKSVNLESFNSLLHNYLPGFYEDRIDVYVNESYSEARQMAKQQFSWHVGFFSNILYWVTQLLIVFSYFTILRNHKRYRWIVPLFAFSLLIYGFSNILSSVPSGGRYIVIARMFMVPVFLLVVSYLPLGKYYKSLLPYLMSLLAFSFIFEIRKGLDYYGITLILGNFLTVPFLESNIPLISFIKQIF